MVLERFARILSLVMVLVFDQKKEKIHVVTHLCEMGRDPTEVGGFMFFPHESGVWSLNICI